MNHDIIMASIKLVVYAVCVQRMDEKKEVVRKENAVMKVRDLLAMVEEHTTDELSLCMAITEKDARRLQVSFRDQEVEDILLNVEKDDNMYESIFQIIWQYFKDRVRIIKVYSVMEGEYLYLMIDSKVCILMRYQYEAGKQWLRQICHES